MQRSYAAIITTYNRPQLVRQAVESLMQQTRKLDEILVVLDGQQEEVARSLMAEFPAIRVVCQENRGAAIARNTGVALAKSDFVGFLDDDDLWHREKVAAVDAYLSAHPDCLAVNHPVWWFSEEENGPDTAYGFKRDFVARNLEQCQAAVAGGDPSSNDFSYLQIEGNSFAKLLEKNCGTLSGTFIARKTVIGAGGFPPMSTVEDWPMFTNVARLTEWHTIPRRLTFCRLHSGQATNLSANGVASLTTLVNSWLTGRPDVSHVKPSQVEALLATKGESYRRIVQNYVWGAVRSGDYQIARLCMLLGKLLLPRRRDRLYAMIPPQVTWRVERYLLGMHK